MINATATAVTTEQKDENDDVAETEKKQDDDGDKKDTSDDNNNNNGAGGERGELMYERLCEMVENQLETQTDYLKSYINELESKENNDSWNTIKNYSELLVCDPIIGVRQDSIIDIKTGKEVLDFANKVDFEYTHLKGLSDQVATFSFHHHYDVNGYLSKLLINGHSLNASFHETMKKIFGLHL